MRITQTTIASNSLYNLQSGLNRMQELQNKLGTGLEIAKPSDGPERFLTGQQARSSIARNETYVRNADNAQAWLKITDSTLQDVTKRLHRVRDITLRAANQVHSDVGYKAMAGEIKALKEGLLELTETEYAGRKVFAGTADPGASGVYNDKTATNPYKFNGDANPVYRTLGPETKLNIGISADKFFGSGDTSIFAELDKLAEHIEAGDTDKIRKAITKIDDRHSKVLDALGSLGTIHNRVDSLRARAVDQIAALKQHKSEAESADLAETTVAVMTQKVAYEAALNATSRVIQPSLMDFMR